MNMSRKQLSGPLVALVLAASSLGSAAADPAHSGVFVKPIAVTPAMIVQGAHVNIVAQWNEAKSETGRYQAPEGYVIKSATPVVQSELRSSSHVTVRADRREASLAATVRGKGEFWNKERGWFQGYLNIELEPIR
jgi:hypothetical protein